MDKSIDGYIEEVYRYPVLYPLILLIQLLSSLQFPESLVSNTINFTRNVVTPEQAFDDLLLKIDVER